MDCDSEAENKDKSATSPYDSTLLLSCTRTKKHVISVLFCLLHVLVTCHPVCILVITLLFPVAGPSILHPAQFVRFSSETPCTGCCSQTASCRMWTSSLCLKPCWRLGGIASAWRMRPGPALVATRSAHSSRLIAAPAPAGGRHLSARPKSVARLMSCGNAYRVLSVCLPSAEDSQPVRLQGEHAGEHSHAVACQLPMSPLTSTDRRPLVCQQALDRCRSPCELLSRPLPRAGVVLQPALPAETLGGPPARLHGPPRHAAARAPCCSVPLPPGSPPEHLPASEARQRGVLRPLCAPEQVCHPPC